MRTSILFITLIAVVSGTAVASDAPLRMHRKVTRRGDCVTCHRTIIPTETNTAMELRKETFHDGTLLCQYQSIVKKSDGDGDGDEGSSVDDGDGEDELEPKEEDVEDDEDGDEDEEDKEDDEEDAEEDEGDEGDRDDNEDDADEDADKEDDEEKEDEEDEDEEDENEQDEDEADEDEEDEDEKDEEECDPNDKYERRALGTHLNGAQDLRGRDDDTKQSDGYTVEYDCVYDVASGNLLEDQARSCPPVVSSSC